MRNAALKKEMEDVVAAWPAAPTFYLSGFANDNKHDSLATFNREMSLWLDQIPQLTGTLERLFAEADDDDSRTLIKIVAPLGESMEAVLQKLASLLDVGSEQKTEAERHGRDILLGWLHTCRECKDRLMRVIWDHDPDARGGSKFHKADDLIAFLEN